MPLVGLLPLVGGWRRVAAIAYALGATGSYVFYFYLWPALDWTPDRFVVQSWAAGIAHGPAWLVLIAAASWRGWRAIRQALATGRPRGASEPRPLAPD